MILRLLKLTLILPLLLLAVNANASNGVDFPLGKTEGTGYAVTGLEFLGRYDYQGDGIEEFHPGEDWNEARNGRDYGNDNNDFGDPVYAISEGTISYARLHSAGWGNLVMIEHQLNGIKFWSQYGHLKNLAPGIREGMHVNNGEILGNVGSFPYGTNKNIHLHFEIRKVHREAYDFVYNWDAGRVGSNYYKPTEFINSHRPLPPVAPPTVSVENKDGGNVVTWDKGGDGFDHYEVSRGGSVIATINDQNATSFIDKNINPGNIYGYKVSTFYKTGQVGTSAEITIEVKIEVRRISTTSNDDRYPSFSDGKIFYQSIPQSGKPTDLPLLYYYDINSGEFKSVNITGCNFKYPNAPNANNNLVAFYGYINASAKDEICYFNLNTGNASPVSLPSLPNSQLYPVASNDGLIFWEDYKNGNTNIDIYFLNTKTSTGPEPFVTAPKNQIHPKVWGNKVVWKDARNYATSNEYDFYIKEIGSSTEEKIVTGVGDSFYSFWDKYIVWTNRGKLSLYNIETKTTTILKESAAGYSPAIRDGKIAYTFSENNTTYLYVYDIATATSLKIDFNLNGYNAAPSIWQNYIAFDTPNDKTKPYDFDIYLVQI